MTRDEHLACAKQRALDYCAAGDFHNAVASMLLDLGKHPELLDHPGIALGRRMFFGGLLNSHSAVRDWINGFQ